MSSLVGKRKRAATSHRGAQRRQYGNANEPTGGAVSQSGVP